MLQMIHLTSENITGVLILGRSLKVAVALRIERKYLVAEVVLPCFRYLAKSAKVGKFRGYSSVNY